MFGFRGGDIANVGYRLVSWASIVRHFSQIIEYLLPKGGDVYCEKFFLRSILFQEEFYPPLYAFGESWSGPFTLENHIHVKALRMPGFPNN